MKKNGFLLYQTDEALFELLDPEDCKSLILGIFAYDRGEPPNMTQRAETAFKTIKKHLDASAENYKKVSAIRKEAAEKRWDDANAMQTDAKECKCNANAYDFDLDIDLDIDLDKEKYNPPLSPFGGERAKQQQRSRTKRAKTPKTDEQFERFWAAYPRKRSKATAYKTWQKIKPDQPLLNTILHALEQQKLSAQWQRDNGQYIPYPATWLNGGRWEDEPEKPEKKSVQKMPVFNYTQRDDIDYDELERELASRPIKNQEG